MLHYFGGYIFEVVLHYFSVTKCYLMEGGFHFVVLFYKFVMYSPLHQGGPILRPTEVSLRRACALGSASALPVASVLGSESSERP